MPGAALLGHMREDRAVFIDRVMRADARRRIAQPRHRARARLHAGVVHQQNVDRRVLRTLVEIRRRCANALHHTPSAGFMVGNFGAFEHDGNAQQRHRRADHDQRRERLAQDQHAAEHADHRADQQHRADQRHFIVLQQDVIAGMSDQAAADHRIGERRPRLPRRR